MMTRTLSDSTDFEWALPLAGLAAAAIASALMLGGAPIAPRPGVQAGFAHYYPLLLGVLSVALFRLDNLIKASVAGGLLGLGVAMLLATSKPVLGMGPVGLSATSLLVSLIAATIVVHVADERLDIAFGPEQGALVPACLSAGAATVATWALNPTPEQMIVSLLASLAVPAALRMANDVSPWSGDRESRFLKTLLLGVAAVAFVRCAAF